VKKSVGLVVMVMMPQKDGSEVMKAVLQRRGRFNTEKMAPESYPGCCQVTTHGKLEEGEDFDLGLANELGEELGQEFATTYCHGYHSEIVSEVKTTEKEVITFGALMPLDALKTIRLGPDSGGLVYVTAEQMSKDNPDLVELVPGEKGSVMDKMKIYGPVHTGTIAMFPDEIEAVRKAFEVFGKK